MKKTILDFKRMAKTGEKIIYLTCYDYLTAKYQERAGVEMILVGDSLGMVELGYKTTFPVTMDDMIRHSQAVRRGAPDTFIVGDMPYMSYQRSNEDAIYNAGRFVKEADMDCVKLEGMTDAIIDRIRAISQAGILVMGHIGLTPQFAGQMGGYKAQGKSADAAMKALSGGLITHASAAMAFMTQFDHVLPIWGIQRETELEQWLGFMDNTPAPDKDMQAFLEKERKELCGDFCRGCGYCMPCPQGIQISTCARMSLMLRRAPSAAWLGEEMQAEMKKIESCIGCRKCTAHCPYELDTPTLLKKNYEDYKRVLAGEITV